MTLSLTVPRRPRLALPLSFAFAALLLFTTHGAKAACSTGTYVDGCELQGEAKADIEVKKAKLETQSPSSCFVVSHSEPLDRYWVGLCHDPGHLSTKPTAYAAGNPLLRRNLGDPDLCVPAAGNPINQAIGNKFQREADYVGPGEGGLRFERFYNSQAEMLASDRDPTWRHTYARMIAVTTAGGTTKAQVWRQDGQSLLFTLSSGMWIGEAGVSETLVRLTDPAGVFTGWRFVDRQDRVELYDAAGALTSIAERSGANVSLTYSDASTPPETAPHPGLLIKVTDQHGRALQFFYDSAGRMRRMSDPSGLPTDYGYDAIGRLVWVLRPGGTLREYRYNEPTLTGGADLPWALTGIIDENAVRFATYGYDANRRAVLTEHAGVQRFTLSYATSSGTPTQTVLTLPEGGQLVQSFAMHNGVVACSGADKPYQTTRNSRSYDGQGSVNLETDFLGSVTDSDYDSRRLLTRRTEAVGDPLLQRTTETDWHPTLRVPTERRVRDAGGVLIAESTWSYNERGQVLAARNVDPGSGTVRETTHHYCEAAGVAAGTCPMTGRLLWTDGPRDDVSDRTTFSYYMSDAAGCANNPADCPYRRGDLHTVTNALGHVTTYQRYDGAGRVQAISDPNGVVTEMTYHPRGWLLSRTVKGATVAQDATTRFDYDAVGNITRITQPDGSALDYAYDAASRLVAISDGLGSRIDYTLDAAGNRTAEQTSAATGVITRRLTRVYDQLGRLDQQLDAQARSTSYVYDANGNATATVDPMAVETRQEYDPLNRLTRTIQDYAGLASTTGFAYDALDRLTEVTDPNGLVTRYSYDGLGDLRQLDSPDTGTTSYTYDAAGNRQSQTDARGVTVSYSYDALNRLTAADYPDLATDVSYRHDSYSSALCPGSKAIGRLTELRDGTAFTAWCYDARGNVTARHQEIARTLVQQVQYRYDSADRLVGITYPSGIDLVLARDALGQVSQAWLLDTERCGYVGCSRARIDLLSAATYLPFGPLAQLRFVDGRTQDRLHDGNYRLEAVQGGNGGWLDLDLTLDALGQVEALRSTDPQEAARGYGYDGLGRLNEVRDGLGAVLEGYGYDPTGNRTHKQRNGSLEPYSYPPDSHRLIAVAGVPRSYDAAGNLTAIGSDRSLHYDARNRLSEVRDAGATVANYGYNGRGERVYRQREDGSQTVFAYDEQGRLLSEYHPHEARHRDYYWIDALLIGFSDWRSDQTEAYLVEADHLGTPRAVYGPYGENTSGGGDPELVTASSGMAVRRWAWPLSGSAFGEHAPDEDVDGDGFALTFDLRFPGQYYDAESGLHYNYFRDYEAGSGRYVQSDPIGLGGGSSTYAYAGASPYSAYDPLGLFSFYASCSQQQRTELTNAMVDLMKDLTLKCAAGAVSDCGSQCAACENYGDILKYFTTSAKFSCRSNASCGQVSVNGDTWISPSAFDPRGSCGCLKATLLHEALHIAADLGASDADEEQAEKITLSCVPCGKGGAL